MQDPNSLPDFYVKLLLFKYLPTMFITALLLIMNVKNSDVYK